jgi:aryl-alcohol dehydrogenase
VLPAVRAKYWNINAQGRFPFEKPVKFYSLDQINQAAQDSEKGGTIKPIIRLSAA